MIADWIIAGVVVVAVAVASGAAYLAYRWRAMAEAWRKEALEWNALSKDWRKRAEEWKAMVESRSA